MDGTCYNQRFLDAVFVIPFLFLSLRLIVLNRQSWWFGSDVPGYPWVHAL